MGDIVFRLKVLFRPVYLVLALGLMLQLPTVALSGEATIAVASNFAEVLDKLKAGFEAKSPHKISVSIGSTGKLYAQIINGAPFDILLAADQARPQLLEARGTTVAASRFTYATGKLTLWSADANLIAPDGAVTLRNSAFRALAMANPDLAPYGRAARDTLISLGLWQRLGDKVVEGQNIGQAYSLVATGNAELGFVARSYVMSQRNKITGSRWDVPDELYQPIKQDAVLVTRAADNEAAIAFMNYLKSAAAKVIIRRFGYGVD